MLSWATIESPFLLRSFSTFFRFLIFFLKLSWCCDVFMFIVGFFPFFINKYWKKYMYVTTICKLPFSALQKTSFKKL